MNTLFLKPGDLFFGPYQSATAHTILGSCVGVVIKSDKHRLLGISHSLLPESPVGAQVLSGRFVTDVFRIFASHARRAGLALADFDAIVAGGGDMFVHHGPGMTIGEKNIARCMELLATYNINVKQQHVGGKQYRKLSVLLSNGQVEVQSSPVHNFELISA